MKIRMLTWVTAILLLTACGARAQCNNFYQAQVIRYLDHSQPLQYLYDHNFRSIQNGRWCGYVPLRSYQDQIFHLESGYTYAFAGVCDSDCDDMDMVLYDPGGNQIARDNDRDDTPVVALTAAQTGNYTLRISAPGCNAFVGCYWAVQLVGK